jgi:hypothetical protein
VRASCLLLLALATPLFAQQLTEDSSTPPWYQVEVIIFQYLENAAETEHWPLQPELAYPSRLRHLRAGSPDAGLQQAFEFRQIEQMVPRPPFELAWDKSVEQLLQEYRESLDPLSASAPLPVLEGEPLESAPPTPETSAPLDPMDLTIPRAFVSLQEDATEFSQQALRIRRSRDMRLLFHRSWLQPVRAREFTLPLAV